MEVRKKQKKCKWCGKPFTPTHNRQEYGTTGIHEFTIKRNGNTEKTNCKKEARRWQKNTSEKQAYHQQNKYNYKRYYPNNEVLGTTNPSSKKMHKNPTKEYMSIQREFQRLGLRKQI